MGTSKKVFFSLLAFLLSVFVIYGQTETIRISESRYMEVSISNGMKSVKIYDACWSCQGTSSVICNYCGGRGISGYGMYASICTFCYGGRKPCRACHSGTPGYQLIADYIENNTDYAKIKEHTAQTLNGLKKGDFHVGCRIKSISHTYDAKSDWWMIFYENGYTHSIRFVTCTSCNGGKTCNVCHGVGYQFYSNTGQKFPCRLCRGSKDCNTCNGSGIAMHDMIQDPSGFQISTYGNSISGGYANSSSRQSDSSIAEHNTYNPCPVCLGSGECMKCLGRGVYYDGKWTNTTRVCICDNGNCRACYGTGQRH